MTGIFSNLYQLFFGKPKISPEIKENETIRLIMERRSCRSFTGEEIHPEHIRTILEAGRFAPSAVNLQTWSFITFSNRQWKETFDQSIPFKGAFAIVICADMHKIRELLPDFKDTPHVNNSFALFNAGLAAMNMTLAAEAMDLGSIMLSETGKTGLLDMPHLKEKLELPDRVLPVTTLVIGRPVRKLPGIPPRQPQKAVQMETRYDLQAGNNLTEWYQQMMVGYKMTHPFSSLHNQIEFYRKKMIAAEKTVERVFKSE